MSNTTATDGPPDWSTHSADLTCPLCDYNLRGLVDPRCPECGFGFTWTELLDAGRDRHPWLFEHARRRRVRSFLATYFRDALPRRFWRSVTPIHTVHVRRLFVYWLLAASVAISATAIDQIYSVVILARRNIAIRATVVAAPGYPGFVQRMSSGLHPPPAFRFPQSTLDRDYPSPSSMQFWRDTLGGRAGRTVRNNGSVPEVELLPMAAVAAWPWLTAAALLVFQASMRRAKVRVAHVLRVAVYGCDFGLLAGAALGGYWVLLRFWQPLNNWLTWQRPIPLLNAQTLPILLMVSTCTTIGSYRLAIACRTYLKFERPILIVLSTQLIAALIVAVVFLATHRVV